MPIHDWTRAPVGLYHHFHQYWSIAICDVLNAGLLPSGFFALIEVSGGGVVPDILAVSGEPIDEGPPRPGNAVMVADAPPKARLVRRASEAEVYASKANKLAIKNSAGQTVSVVELVSPGNKSNARGLDAFVEKARMLLMRGVHLLVVDLFPPTPRDPHGLHPLIWGEPEPDALGLPADKPLLTASYDAGPPAAAYVEPRAVGDELPDAPMFIEPEWYVPLPLERTYVQSWERCPAEYRRAVTQSIAE
jgi:hypothetical protein